MSRRLFGSLLVVGALPLLLSGTAARSTEVSTAAQTAVGGPRASTIDDQIDLALTVYTSGLALVRDVRALTLPSGVNDLEFSDISATVNPATVHLRSLTQPGQLSVVEQNYQYDLLEPEKLLRKYVGRHVTLVRRETVGGTSREETVTATLLAYNNGPVWKIGDEIVTGLHADHLRFLGVPANLRSRPTLVWTLDNTGAREHRVEASYLASNLQWNADYVLTVGRDDRSASLGGWVTLVNQSGTEFRNTRLQLVAGDLNRVKGGDGTREEMQAAMLRASADSTAFARETFSEYHLYSLDRRTTIANSEAKQISLLEAEGVPVEKLYVVEGQQFYYHNAQHPGAPLKDAVRVHYRLRNDAKSSLGMPLPAGTVRVYQADSRGGLQFAGEDRIDHTPGDETVTLHVGNAFDVVCERKQTDFQALGRNLYELAFEVTLRNHKATAISVDVNEPIGGSWDMLDSSHPATKTAAWAASFTVPVPAGGVAKLSYRVRARR
jgi:hypothetical protein